MLSIQKMFSRGMDRDIPDLAEGPAGVATLELGPGTNKKDLNADYWLDLPQWNAEKDLIPPPAAFGLGALWGEIHAYHFMEHLTGQGAMFCLRNMQTVLHDDGVINLTIPYYRSAMMFQALDHQSFWSEETWRWLFGDQYNANHTHGWHLKVHACFIMGIKEANLALFTQLIKIGGKHDH